MNRVLVTGATGFIGHALCASLNSNGLFVRAQVRQETAGPWHESVAVDFSDGELPAGLCDGIETVFHLAGKAHALTETSQDENEYFSVNTEATHRLLKAAGQAGVQTFVYFSSVKAVGDIDGVMDESVSEQADTPYGRSKHAAEKLVLEGGYVPHPVVIRPSMVYGSTAKGNLPKMIQAIESGRFPPLPEVHNRRSMVHVDDVVQASILAAESAKSCGKIYIVTDGNSYSTRQIYEWICEALHKPLPRWYLPMVVMRLMGRVGDMIGSIRGRRFIFDSDALEKLTGNANYSSKRIQDELGFKSSRNLRESLPGIIAYLQANRT